MSAYLIPYLKLLGWVLAPLGLGYALRRAGAPKRTSRGLFLFALLGCQMPIVLLAVWVAEISKGARYLPLMTLAGWIVTAGVARLVSGMMDHGPRRRGAFIVSMALSNHGYTLLGLIALVLFGQAGIAQATYAQALVVPFLVLVCFPIGRFYGRGHGQMSMRSVILDTLRDPRSLPLAAMIAGLALQAGGVPRPAWCARVLRVLVYAGTVTSGMAVGFLLRKLDMTLFVRENVFSFVYRSTVYPLMFFLMARLAGLNHTDTCILVLFGLVPCALFASLVADFFDLDTDLTSNMFLIGTLLFLLVTLPVYVAIAM